MKKIAVLLIAIIISGLGYWLYKRQEKQRMDVQLIPREVLFGNPERAAVRLSSDGKHLSYLANLDGVLNIFVAKIETPHEGSPITKDKGRGIRRYFWLYDNQHIAYLKDDGGDENWRIHVINISTNEDKVYTSEKVNARIYQVSDKHPGEIIIGLNDCDQAWHDVYRLNICTGGKKLIFKNDREFNDYIFDDQYNLRFASKTTTEGGTESFKAILDDKSGQYTWESFIKVGHEDVYTTEQLGLTADGNILYILDSRGRDLNVLKEINLKTNVEKILGEGKKSEIDGIITAPDTSIIQAYSTNYLRKEWICLDKEIEDHLNTIKQTLKGDVTIASRTLDDHLWVVADMKDDGPIGYYLYQKAKKVLTFLFNNRDALAKYTLAKMEGIVVKARDGLDLPSYLTKPINAKGLVPLVVVVHGGPHLRDGWSYDSEVQWLANRGYAVLQVNYRGSTGFGKAFIAKANLEWGGKMHEDLLDAVSWAIKEGIADPTKVAIYGGSYGGYAALWGATNSGDTFKCAVDIVGPSNLHTMQETIPPYWETFKEMEYREIGDPRTAEGKKLLTERSPLTHVDKIKIPLLIAQGEKDPRVKQAESEQIVTAMKAKDLPFVYMLFMDEGHGFARPENNIAFYGVAERFLADNLGGRYERFTEEELSKSTLPPAQKKELALRFNG